MRLFRVRQCCFSARISEFKPRNKFLQWLMNRILQTSLSNEIPNVNFASFPTDNGKLVHVG